MAPTKTAGPPRRGATTTTWGARLGARKGHHQTRTALASATSDKDSTAATASSSAGYKVRVLRYPDGYERVLRYPKDKRGQSASAQASSSSALVEHSRDSWDIAGARRSPQQQPEVAEKPPAVAEKPPTPEKTEDETPSTTRVIPDTPMELLRKQRSPEFLLSSKLEWEHAKSSFDLLDSCVWLEPRPVFVLGTLDSSGGVQTYTLRTRIPKGDAESEMLGLIGKKIEISHLTDGVVAFQSKASADAFAEENAGQSGDLFVFEVGSHDLFQMTMEAKAVVVLMREEAKRALPSARMLAAVLRDQPKMDT